MNSFNSAPVLKTRPPALRCSTGMRLLPSGSRISMGTPVAIVQMDANLKPLGPSNTPDSARRCRWSFGVGPYSSWRLLAVSYTHLRAHETPEHLVCRLL